MSLSAKVAGGDVCGISRRWKVAPTLARMVVALEERAALAFASQGVRWPGLWIISGYRTPAKQARVNPLVPDSLHTLCPSLAIDLRVGDLPASTTPPEIWATLGQLWKELGGRWGGDFQKRDLNHFETLTVKGGPVAADRARLGVTPVLIAPKIPFTSTKPRVPLRPQVRSRPLLR